MTGLDALETAVNVLAEHAKCALRNGDVASYDHYSSAHAYLKVLRDREGAIYDTIYGARSHEEMMARISV